MIDVHAPHSSIGNVGEFFLHLFTITIGLLIAVGIEAAVEQHQHHELALQASQTMTAEIRKNVRRVDDALADIEREQQKNTQNLANIQKVQLAPNSAAANDANIDVTYNITGLEDTAWSTAQTTGALAFMPYAESEKFSSIYGTAQTFQKAEDQLQEDEASILGTIEEFHVGVGKGKLTEDGANAMAKQLGISQGHLMNLKIAARVLQNEQNAFLEGREPSHSMSERLSN